MPLQGVLDITSTLARHCCDTMSYVIRQIVIRCLSVAQLANFDTTLTIFDAVDYHNKAPWDYAQIMALPVFVLPKIFSPCATESYPRRTRRTSKSPKSCRTVVEQELPNFVAEFDLMLFQVALASSGQCEPWSCQHFPNLPNT